MTDHLTPKEEQDYEKPNRKLWKRRAKEKELEEQGVEDEQRD